MGLDGGSDDGAGDVSVSSPHKYVLLPFLYSLLNFYFFTRLRVRTNGPPPSPLQSTNRDSRCRCVSSPWCFLTAPNSPHHFNNDQVGLDGRVRHMGLETQTSPAPTSTFFIYFIFYTLLNFTFLLDYVCKQMNERPPLSNLIRERRTGTRWRGSTYGAGDVCGSSPHSTFILLLFFYSTKFIFLLDYLIERVNGHLDRHTQVPGQQRTGDSRHICLESLVFFFCYERFGRFFFFLLRFLQSKWFFVTSYKYGTTTNGHAH